MHPNTAQSLREFDPEFACLCQAVGRALGFRAGDALPDGAPDVERLTRLAINHHCLPLLAMGVDLGEGRRCLLELSCEMQARWTRLLAGNASRSLFLAKRMVELLTDFSAMGICALAWKGSALSQLLYGRVEMRPSDDIDLWVHPRDFARACERLEQQGFIPLIRLSPVEAVSHRRAGWDRGFRSPAGDYVVELCVGMAPQYYARLPDPREVLESAVELEIGGGPIRTVGGALLMELLCLHGMKHGWSRLLWLADVAVLSRLQGAGVVDWDLFWWKTARNGTRRMAILGFRLAHRYLNAPIERGGVPVDLLDQAGRLLEGKETCQGFWPEFTWYSRGCVRWSDRFRYLLLLILTPSFGDWRSISLPGGLFWLHWILRPFRMLLLGRRQSRKRR